jgi:hypothetical protein
MTVLVAIESPVRATETYTREQHYRYFQECVRDCLNRGELPYGSHWLTQILDDDNPSERALGIHCGLSWSAKCNYAAMYCDLGQSPGMLEAIKFYNQIGKRVERRTLGYGVIRMIQEMGDANLSEEYAEPELTSFT